MLVWMISLSHMLVYQNHLSVLAQAHCSRSCKACLVSAVIAHCVTLLACIVVRCFSALRPCSEPWLHACLNLLHFRLRELDPEGLATIAISLVKLSVIISNGELVPESAEPPALIAPE